MKSFFFISRAAVREREGEENLKFTNTFIFLYALTSNFHLDAVVR